MNIQHDEDQEASARGHPLVLPLSALDAGMLSLVGGNAANLGELIRAGFAVPPGFCITTTVYTLVSAGAGIDPLLADLATPPHDDPTRPAELAAAVRSAMLQAPLPSTVVTAITGAYQALGEGESIPAAVRSSATAEDLPSASFAGQQDTFLSIIGIEAVLAAVQRCWASLWTERAVSYRARLGIDPRSVRLAVVVQRMVDAQVAGVLFTANPLSGKRRQAVIDATPGLGEALVSGQANPDHFVVDTPSGTIVERGMGDQRTVLPQTPGIGHTEQPSRLPGPHGTPKEVARLGPDAHLRDGLILHPAADRVLCGQRPEPSALERPSA